MSFNWNLATREQLLAQEEATGGDLLGPYWIRQKGLATDRPDISPSAAHEIAVRASTLEAEESRQAWATAGEGRDKLQQESINPAAEALAEQNDVTRQTAEDLRSGRISVADAALVLERSRIEVARLEGLLESWRGLDAIYTRIAEDPQAMLDDLFHRYPALAQHRRTL